MNMNMNKFNEFELDSNIFNSNPIPNRYVLCLLCSIMSWEIQKGRKTYGRGCSPFGFDGTFISFRISPIKFVILKNQMGRGNTHTRTHNSVVWG